MGIRLALEEATGKYFPASNSAAEVRDRLVAACRRHGVEFSYGAGLQDLQRQPDGTWRLLLQGGGSVAAARVVLATGGLSFPRLGATGDGYRLLRQHGHSLHEPYPALTPLLGAHPGQQQLAGISLYEAELAAVPAAGGGGGGGGKRRAKAGGRAQRTAMLFTHRGYSGPAVLDLSHHAVRALERQQPAPRIQVQWTPHGAADWEGKMLEGGALLVPSLLRREGLPQRLAEALCGEAGVPLDRWGCWTGCVAFAGWAFGVGAATCSCAASNLRPQAVRCRKLSELRKAERAALVEALTRYTLPVSGSEGYAKAEVTGGGVPLNELDVSKMQSRVLPGVYVCGELCDVFGRIGGFNFWWAWVSGRLAGLSAAEAAAADGER